MQEQGPEAGEGSKKAATTPMFSFRNAARCHMLLSLVLLAISVEEHVYYIAFCGGFPCQFLFCSRILFVDRHPEDGTGARMLKMPKMVMGRMAHRPRSDLDGGDMGPHATTKTSQNTLIITEAWICQPVRLEAWLVVSRYMDVSKNRCTPKSSILIGFSIINHPFWRTPIFGNTHIRGCTPSLSYDIVHRNPDLNHHARRHVKSPGEQGQVARWALVSFGFFQDGSIIFNHIHWIYPPTQ